MVFPFSFFNSLQGCFHLLVHYTNVACERNLIVLPDRKKCLDMEQVLGRHSVWS